MPPPRARDPRRQATLKSLSAMKRWVGKTAVVTGASVGIGAAVSVQLANSGMEVVGLTRRTELVDKLNAEVTGKGTIYGRKCDVAKKKEIAEAFKWVEDKMGGVDLLVNNAGLLVQGDITELAENPISDEAIQNVIDINVESLKQCLRRAVASMEQRGFNGHIVNINSVAGHHITAFTTALTDELAHTKSKIKTTSISLGLVDKAMAGLPMLRVADVASAVIYAVSTTRDDVNILELAISSVTAFM